MSGILGGHFMHDLIVFLFAVSGGITLSAIMANSYRLVAKKPQGKAGLVLHYAVMVVAGPSVLLENATRSYRKDDCSDFAYLIAVAVSGYWAFAIGVLLLTLYAVVR